MNPIADLMSLVFPETCVVCAGPVTKAEQSLCISCRSELPSLLSRPFSSHEPLRKKFEGLLPVTHSIAFLQFVKGGSAQRLLHALKYGRRPEVGRVLGRLLAAELQELGLGQSFDLVIPVPLHKKKLRTRGYNQSMQFAMGIAEGLAVEATEDILIRRTATETQTKKNKLQRILNVSEVFDLDPALKTRLAGRRILLVDDVTTTGSTFEACGKILVREPIGALSVAAIAMA
jgi:ComF family protein